MSNVIERNYEEELIEKYHKKLGISIRNAKKLAKIKIESYRPPHPKPQK